MCQLCIIWTCIPKYSRFNRNQQVLTESTCTPVNRAVRPLVLGSSREEPGAISSPTNKTQQSWCSKWYRMPRLLNFCRCGGPRGISLPNCLGTRWANKHVAWTVSASQQHNLAYPANLAWWQSHTKPNAGIEDYALTSELSKLLVFCEMQSLRAMHVCVCLCVCVCVSLSSIYIYIFLLSCGTSFHKPQCPWLHQKQVRKCTRQFPTRL